MTGTFDCCARAETESCCLVAQPYDCGLRPFNRYSLAAALLVVAAGAIAQPPVLGVVGLAALSLAVHFWVWEPERDEVFADDWIELGSLAASLVCAVAGTGMLIVAAL
ncbi:MAG: hypothetical protein WKF94_16100 [Solirubrobacteraceae bacterium]